jgi:hypothetical protein
LRSYAV